MFLTRSSGILFIGYLVDFGGCTDLLQTHIPLLNVFPMRYKSAEVQDFF